MPALRRFDKLSWVTAKCPRCGEEVKVPHVLLSSPMRARLFSLIRERGEITLTEAVRELKTSKQNLTKNHIPVLERLGIVRVEGGGSHREETKLKAVSPKDLES